MRDRAMPWMRRLAGAGHAAGAGGADHVTKGPPRCQPRVSGSGVRPRPSLKNTRARSRSGTCGGEWWEGGGQATEEGCPKCCFSAKAERRGGKHVRGTGQTRRGHEPRRLPCNSWPSFTRGHSHCPCTRPPRTHLQVDMLQVDGIAHVLAVPAAIVGAAAEAGSRLVRSARRRWRPCRCAAAGTAPSST